VELTNGPPHLDTGGPCSEFGSGTKIEAAGIPLFHFYDGVDEFLLRSRWVGPTPTLGSERHAVLLVLQQLVETPQGGRLQKRWRKRSSCGAHEKSTQTGEDTIRGTPIGRTIAAPIEDQQWMAGQYRLGQLWNGGLRAART